MNEDELVAELAGRCPTCGSDDRAVRLLDDPSSSRAMLCPDDWHMVPRDALLAFEVRCNGELIGESVFQVRLAPGANVYVPMRPIGRLPGNAYLRLMLIIDGEEIPGWWTYRAMVDLDGQPRDAAYRPGRIFTEPSDVGSLVHFPPRRAMAEPYRSTAAILEDGMWTLSVRAVR